MARISSSSSSAQISMKSQFSTGSINKFESDFDEKIIGNSSTRESSSSSDCDESSSFSSDSDGSSYCHPSKSEKNFFQ